MLTLTEIGIAARAASKRLAVLPTSDKNKILHLAADALLADSSAILEANAEDMERARENGIREVMLDRLRLDEARLAQMAEGLRKVAALPDPVGETLYGRLLPNGLRVQKRRVPLGVIGIIYEARPNVTADSFGLCLKSGNAAILRGGSDAIGGNRRIVGTIRAALTGNGYDADFVQLVEDTSRETATALMRLREYVDVLIPRGGAGLIQSVVKNATIPTIETGTGNCHIFVDESADLENAVKIVVNAKAQRVSVCNSAEKLLVHEKIAAAFIPLAVARLRERGVEIRGSQRVREIIPDAGAMEEREWYEEYLDYIIGVEIVADTDSAIAHIAKYSTGHSEAILTNSLANAEKFTSEVDSAAVYVNSSTRFTDGEVFGLGAEIGISTQKLHARGPMGLSELTSYKYIVSSDWLARE